MADQKKSRMITMEETAAMGREGVTLGIDEMVKSALMKYYENQLVFPRPLEEDAPVEERAEGLRRTIDIPRQELEKKLSEPLPVVMRLNNVSVYRKILLRQIQKAPLWRPVMNLNSTPAVFTCSAKQYHSEYPSSEREWVSRLGKCGRLSFQELVSLVPVLFLQAKSDHYVLDMCSAPGSKCCALAELMTVTSETGMSKGLIIANDISLQRCTHDLARKSERSHCTNIFVLNSNAFTFPPLFNTTTNTPFQFDRVMADVPCSGDGTMRKNPSVWSLWDIDYPMRLHKSQIKILMKGLQLLKPGGILTYSTCSLNPIENEAVVAEALLRFKGLVRIVKSSEMEDENIKGLRILTSYNGLTKWRVPCPKDSTVFYDTFDEVPEEFRGFESEPQKKKSEPKGFNIVHSTMFPKIDPSITKQLIHCHRYQPNHLDNDCGCFFIAVLTKLESTEVPPEVLPLYEPKDELSRRSRKKQFRKIRLMKEMEENRTLESHDSQTKEPVGASDEIEVEELAAPVATVESNLEAADGAAESSDEEEVAVENKEEGAGEVIPEGPSGEAAPTAEPVLGEAALRKKLRKERADKKKIKTRRSDEFVEQTKQILGFQVPYYGRTILNTLHYCNTSSFEWRRLSEFYGFDESKGISKLILAEQNIGSEVRKLSMCSEALHTLSLHCIPFNNKATFIAAGLPFMKRIRGDFLKPALCRWRPCQEAIPLMLAFCTKRVYRVSTELTLTLLRAKQLETLLILDVYPDSKDLGGCILVTEIDGLEVGFACTSCGAVIQLMASDDFISTSLSTFEFALANPV